MYKKYASFNNIKLTMSDINGLPGIQRGWNTGLIMMKRSQIIKVDP